MQRDGSFLRLVNCNDSISSKEICLIGENWPSPLTAMPVMWSNVEKAQFGERDPMMLNVEGMSQIAWRNLSFV